MGVPGLKVSYHIALLKWQEKGLLADVCHRSGAKLSLTLTT